MTLHESTLDTLRQLITEIEHTHAWEIVSADTRAKLRATLIRLEAGRMEIGREADTLRRMIRMQFDAVDWTSAQEYIDLAQNLGLVNLANEMKEDLKNDTNVI